MSIRRANRENYLIFRRSMHVTCDSKASYGKRSLFDRLRQAKAGTPIDVYVFATSAVPLYGNGKSPDNL